jgi:hypothetical protein
LLQAARLSFVLLAVTVASSAADDLDRFHPAQVRAIEAIRPADSELSWQRIAWLTDLDEAVAVAKKEKRPIFLWVAGDEPLDRC